MINYLPRPAWYRHAACTTAEPRLFFPAPGRPGTEAKRICADCPVVQQCADMAIADHGLDGVWGGLTAFERDQIRKRKRVAA